MAITGKLGQFRGESRFTTWACKFAIFEVSAKIGRHFWRHPAVPLDAEDRDRLPDRFGSGPRVGGRVAEWRDLAAALRRAVDEVLTPRQRQVLFTRCCSTPGISCGLFLSLTGIYAMTLRGTHERLAGAGPLPADRSA